MKKKILIFEPWNLGDVAVALSTCKELHICDYEVSMVCDKKFSSWVKATGIVQDVIEFTPPWTARYISDKYNLLHYNFRSFIHFRRQMNQLNPDIIFDLRGDLRAYLFLKIFCGLNKKIISLWGSNRHNIYEKNSRIKTILKLGINSDGKKSYTTKHIEKNTDICLFSGASDFNREIPQEVLKNLLYKLNNIGVHINVILPPLGNIELYNQLKNESNFDNIEFITGNVNQIAQNIQSSSLMISTDSGWLHVAYFYDLKIVGLYAFDTTEIWAPPGINVIQPSKSYPANLRYKKKYRFIQPLQNLELDRVVSITKQLICKF